jgi:hypothetical protein
MLPVMLIPVSQAVSPNVVPAEYTSPDAFIVSHISLAMSRGTQVPPVSVYVELHVQVVPDNVPPAGQLYVGVTGVAVRVAYDPAGP